MRRFLMTTLLALAAALSASAQVDRHDVRAGNRKFRKDNFKEAEIDYRKAVVKDSLSVPAGYNLASSLYRQQDYDGAGKALSTLSEVAPQSADAAAYHFNSGDVALQKQDWKTAVDEFRKALLLTPDDIEAKENYIYAKKKLEDQQNDQNQDQQDQNQDQQNDQNQDQQDQNQNQNQDQNKDNQQNQDQQDQDENRDQQKNENQSGISQQQAQQMLKAIQAKEQETQDKVNKEKAAVLQSKQKEKNW